MTNINYIPHIINSLPEDVMTYQLSHYPVALEGWRRGLRLKYYSRVRGKGSPMSMTYSLSDGEKEINFLCARGSGTTEKAIELAEDKNTANKYMKEAGVPVPEYKTFTFSESSIEEICDYGESIGYPLVVKPTDMGGGNGVTNDIRSRDTLKKAILHVKNWNKRDHVLIEKYFENGVDYRFYVIEDKVIAAKKNYSSNVVGDGINNLKDLIKERNKEISANPATQKRLITADDEMLEFLKESNKTMDYIPYEGERVFLRKHGTHLGKRISLDCTDTIDPKFNKYAVDALNSIPGIPTGSIDMVINEETNEGIVNEINTKGEINTHLFPLEGKGRDIPTHLIDYYFPESKKISDNFYFEYKHVKESFLNGYADEISIPMHPTKTQYKKVYTIRGRRLGPIFVNRLKKFAVRFDFKGNITPISKSEVVLTIIGDEDKIDKIRRFIKKAAKNPSKIQRITSSEPEIFDGISSNSFEIIKENINHKKNVNSIDKNKTSSREFQRVKEECDEKINQKEKEIQDLKEEIREIRESHSWKVTGPLRNIRSKFKKWS